jgi:hypothetical protein
MLHKYEILYSTQDQPDRKERKQIHAFTAEDAIVFFKIQFPYALIERMWANEDIKGHVE